MSDEWLVLLTLGAIGAVSIGAVVLWIWSMVNAAKNGKWVWFVLILLFSPLCLFYLLFADKRPSIQPKPVQMRRDPS